MQVENDYEKEVYNGDIGSTDDVDPDAGELTVTFDTRSVTCATTTAKNSRMFISRMNPAASRLPSYSRKMRHGGLRSISPGRPWLIGI
jgi:hypothetical protein